MDYPVWIYLLVTTGFGCLHARILKPVAAKSSPSHIIATKGSSVWLHWSYTYTGDGKQGPFILLYKEQIIVFKPPLEAPKVLAKRIGQNGTLKLQSPVPAPFNGRVEVIQSNSTLVIHDLQFNDAIYQFTSIVTVNVDVGAGQKSNMFHLLPNVYITVYGTPCFTKDPPRALDVNEYSNLLMDIYTAGNPKPIPYLKWSHRRLEWSGIVTNSQVLGYSYIAKYRLSRIDGSYCGRTLEIDLKNSIGSSTVKKFTTVTVLLKLDKPFQLKVKKLASSKCVEVNWKKANSGVCNVQYTLALRSASGELLYNKTGINIGKRMICSSSTYAKVTDVQLTVSFKGISKVVIAKVSQALNATSVPIKTGFIFARVPILKSIEASSSPSHVIAIKGSSVWLHWNYTYFGDGKHGTARYKFKEEIIGFTTSSQAMVQVLARRIGQNGILMLQSPIPAPFSGRVEVISSNSTLVIHSLQYNDSTYQFSSKAIVDADMGAGPKSNMFLIAHKVVVTVHGAPRFTKQLPRTIGVNEGSKLLLKCYMDGNPKPSAYFKWPHLDQDWSRIVPIVQLHPFVYLTIYKFNEVAGSYCGRKLQIKIDNDVGSSSLKKSIYITVNLKLDRSFDLQARKIAASKCVRVKWKKASSGACNVSYAVALKSASGKVFYNTTKENIGKRKICSLSAYSKITDVELTVSFKGISKVAKAKVSEALITTSAPITTATIKLPRKHRNRTELPISKSSSHGNKISTTKQDTTSHESRTKIIVGSSLAAVVVFLAIIITARRCTIHRQRKRVSDGTSNNGYELCGGQDVTEIEMKPRTSGNENQGTCRSRSTSS